MLKYRSCYSHFFCWKNFIFFFSNRQKLKNKCFRFYYIDRWLQKYFFSCIFHVQTESRTAISYFFIISTDIFIFLLQVPSFLGRVAKILDKKDAVTTNTKKSKSKYLNIMLKPISASRLTDLLSKLALDILQYSIWNTFLLEVLII